MVDDGRTTDGRTTEHGYTISSPCEPDGSGELIMLMSYVPCSSVLRVSTLEGVGGGFVPQAASPFLPSQFVTNAYPDLTNGGGGGGGGN